MTRKDYTAIAKAVAEVLKTCEVDSAESTAVEFLAIMLADVCEDDNPRFDRKKFFTACGI
jgi:hypothetical protein